MILSRSLHSQTSLPKLHTIGVCRSWRLLSTYSNRVDEPFKVEELEKINVSPSEKIDVSSPSLKKLLVLSGNGFVGSRVSRSFEA
ncbi:hypothetical protein AAC387_Pa07g1931 [Persea americana]